MKKLILMLLFLWIGVIPIVAQSVKKNDMWFLNKGQISYVGFGLGIGTNVEMQLALLDVRYKWFEIRPCLWGINGPIMPVNQFDRNLPPAVVNPDSYDEYSGYIVHMPSCTFQYFYTPMVRFHYPIRKKKTLSQSIVFGAGPQISWTEVEWTEENKKLGELADDVMFSQAAPDNITMDDLWFTLEVAYVVKNTIKDRMEMDCAIYAKYLDGFSIGFEFRFGKKIKNNKFQQGILKGKNKKDITK